MATSYQAARTPSRLRMAIGLGALAEVVVYVLVASWIGLGWTILAALGPLSATVSSAGLTLLVTGGVLYSVGVAFHLWRSLPFQNAVWHGFVLAAAACHYAAVLREVVAAA